MSDTDRDPLGLLGLRLITSLRKRTRGNVYDYDYWECGWCKWHPGSSDGPPGPCINCGRSPYTSDVSEATQLIEVTRTDCGYGYKLVYDFHAFREAEIANIKTYVAQRLRIAELESELVLDPIVPKQKDGSESVAPSRL